MASGRAAATEVVTARAATRMVLMICILICDAKLYGLVYVCGCGCESGSDCKGKSWALYGVPEVQM